MEELLNNERQKFENQVKMESTKLNEQEKRIQGMTLEVKQVK